MRAGNLLANIRFEGIEPGNYASEAGFCFNIPKPKKPFRTSLMGFERGLSSRGISFGAKTRIGASTRRETVKHLIPADKEKEDEELESFADAMLLEAGEDDFSEISSVEVCSAFEYEEPPKMKEIRAAKVSEKKPDSINQLEQILSNAYNTHIKITRVRDLPQTRKQVREVFFLINNGISKVWVFKADPKKTAQELNAYHIIYEQGIPTGKPIGYTPSEKAYPFDVAILGGIVEHAGEPYNELIENMVYTPKHIFETACNIACLMADYHLKLTLAKEEFEKYGINLEKSSPRKELNERLLAALNIEEKKAEGLIKACEELYKKQDDSFVVSHGDVHTGNLVTLLETDEHTGLPKTSIERFGVIDWGSLVLDNNYADLWDFWLHHKRIASQVCKNYNFPFDDLYSSYANTLEMKLEAHTLSAEKRRIAFEPIKFNTKKRQKDSLIQSALWNLYEMYDPTRTKQADVKEKAKTHYQNLISDFEMLDLFGCSKQTNKIRKELKKLLKDKEYLH